MCIGAFLRIAEMGALRKWCFQIANYMETKLERTAQRAGPDPVALGLGWPAREQEGPGWATRG